MNCIIPTPNGKVSNLSFRRRELRHAVCDLRRPGLSAQIESPRRPSFQAAAQAGSAEAVRHGLENERKRRSNGGNGRMTEKFEVGHLYYRCSFAARGEPGAWPIVETWVFRGTAPNPETTRNVIPYYYRFCRFNPGINAADGECLLSRSLHDAEITYLTGDELVAAVREVDEQIGEWRSGVGTSRLRLPFLAQRQLTDEDAIVLSKQALILDGKQSETMHPVASGKDENGHDAVFLRLSKGSDQGFIIWCIDGSNNSWEYGVEIAREGDEVVCTITKAP